MCIRNAIVHEHRSAHRLDVHSQYLENLCDYLYDDLRPRILHEPRLTALCEVCTVLQALMVLDVPSVPDSSSDEEADLDDELTLDLDHPRRNRGLRTLHISHLLQMVLQDAQTRLFFKAQSVIQSEIRYYVPRPEDLAYPDKLVGGSRCMIVVPAKALIVCGKPRGSRCLERTSGRSRVSAGFSRSNPGTSRKRGTPPYRRPSGFSRSSMSS